MFTKKDKIVTMKIVVASDSFKGTLSSLDICRLFQDELAKFPYIQAAYLPIADGGEGSLEAIAYSLKGRYVSILTKDPYFRDIETKYYLDEERNAYIETASCAGLTLIDNLNPTKTTTYGLGQQVLDAINQGCKKVYIFLGGSATNDGGCGLFSVLGTKFFNDKNEEFIPVGGTLKDIARIDNSLASRLLQDVEIIGMCDVDNPMHGSRGAAYVYAPQKGADEKMVSALDQGLQNLDEIIKTDLQKSISKIKGSGAAGGIGAGILAFGNGVLHSGIKTILDLVDFDNVVKNADYVITGEGKLDEQSFSGKAVRGIAERCQKQNIKLILVVGNTAISLKKAQKMYSCIENIIETNANHLPYEKIVTQASQMYILAIHELLASISKL